MAKAILRPLGVPWMVTPSTPFLRLHGKNGSELGPVTVTFVGFFGLSAAPASTLPSAYMPEIVNDPGEFQLALAAGSSPYRLVRMTFQEVISAWQLNQIDPVAFDREFERAGDMGDSRESFWKLWRGTGLCPHPGVSEVDPPLGQSEPPSAGRIFDVARFEYLLEARSRCEAAPGTWRHFLIEGHDEFIEVVAKGWTWEEGQPLKDWK